MLRIQDITSFNRGWETRYPENRSLFLRLTRQVLG